MARSKTRCVPVKFLKEHKSRLSRSFPFLPKALLKVKVERAWEGLSDSRKAEYREDKGIIQAIQKSSLSFSFDVECGDASQKESTASHRHYGRKATRASSIAGHCDKEWAELSFTSMASSALNTPPGREWGKSSADALPAGVAHEPGNTQLRPDTEAKLARAPLAVSPADQPNSSPNKGTALAAQHRSGAGSKKKQLSSKDARKQPCRAAASARRKKRTVCKRGRAAALDVCSVTPFTDTSASPPLSPAGPEALRYGESSRSLVAAYQSSSSVLAACLSELEHSTVIPPAAYDDDAAVLDVTFDSDSSLDSCALLDASDVTVGALQELDCVDVPDVVDMQAHMPARRPEPAAVENASSAAALPTATEELCAVEDDHSRSHSREIAVSSAVCQPGGDSHVDELSPAPAASSGAEGRSNVLHPAPCLPGLPDVLSLANESCLSPTPHNGDVALSTAAAADMVAPSSEPANCLLMQPPLMSLFDSPPATPKHFSRRSLRSAMQACLVVPPASDKRAMETAAANDVFM